MKPHWTLRFSRTHDAKPWWQMRKRSQTDICGNSTSWHATAREAIQASSARATYQLPAYEWMQA